LHMQAVIESGGRGDAIDKSETASRVSVRA
jgi:hypothetical protein